MDDLKSLLDQLQGGIEPKNAIELFEQCCRHPATLFITDRWFAPFKQKLLNLLSKPVTAEQAAVLREAVLERTTLQKAVDWLEQHTVSWDVFLQNGRQVKRCQDEGFQEGYFPWLDIKACRGETRLQEAPMRRGSASHGVPYSGSKAVRQAANPCPQCGATLNRLACFYFISPPQTWENHCGRAGWLTVCDHCHVQVQFFQEVMN